MARNHSGIKTSEEVNVKVDVKNTSSIDGDEVVQVYITRETDGFNPTNSLVGFNRIHLKGGETKTVSFKITPKQLATVNLTSHKMEVTSGTVEISVGGAQNTQKKQKQKTVVSKNITLKGKPYLIVK